MQWLRTIDQAIHLQTVETQEQLVPIQGMEEDDADRAPPLSVVATEAVATSGAQAAGPAPQSRDTGGWRRGTRWYHPSRSRTHGARGESRS